MAVDNVDKFVDLNKKPYFSGVTDMFFWG